jgi:hypothetical protein
VIDRAPKIFMKNFFSSQWRRPTSDGFFVVREIPRALATMTQWDVGEPRRGEQSTRRGGRRENRKNYVVA